MALPASVKPMIMATGPVTEAGRIFSTRSMPPQRTSKPAAMDTKPDRMMPNCAWDISSVGRISVAPISSICSSKAFCSNVASAATMLPMAARYAKLEP